MVHYYYINLVMLVEYYVCLLHWRMHCLLPLMMVVVIIVEEGVRRERGKRTVVCAVVMFRSSPTMNSTQVRAPSLMSERTHALCRVAKIPSGEKGECNAVVPSHYLWEHSECVQSEEERKTKSE